MTQKETVDAHIKTDKPTYARDTGAKIDEAVCSHCPIHSPLSPHFPNGKDGDGGDETVLKETNKKTTQAHNAEKNMEQARDATGSYAKERKDELLRGIDKADQKIEEKAKGWFGGGK